MQDQVNVNHTWPPCGERNERALTRLGSAITISNLLPTLGPDGSVQSKYLLIKRSVFPARSWTPAKSLREAAKVISFVLQQHHLYIPKSKITRKGWAVIWAQGHLYSWHVCYSRNPTATCPTRRGGQFWHEDQKYLLWVCAILYDVAFILSGRKRTESA